MRSPLHHFHLRRRVRLKRDPYPHPHASVRTLDSIVLMAGILGPLLSLPQIYRIYSLQEVAGLSLITWLMYAIFDLPWIAYGIVHKEKQIVYAYTGWLLVNCSMVVGILLYSKNGLF